uniref:Uncharacterized protein n=1 Tax=uncultured Desulfobacterium sp. TaxID=201089 RepID=E1YLB1_9BACT|nr:unknown protein [uncultured Desulfobacterium sp.]
MRFNGYCRRNGSNSDKEAIELVRTHANYMWTLVAAAPVVFSVSFLL